jgi:hypothetical protein
MKAVWVDRTRQRAEPSEIMTLPMQLSLLVCSHSSTWMFTHIADAVSAPEPSFRLWEAIGWIASFFDNRPQANMQIMPVIVFIYAGTVCAWSVSGYLEALMIR